MIDYEKLKQVNIMNEDIGKYYLSIRIYRNEILAIELARKPEFMKDIYCDQFFHTDIDALFEFLSKIQLQEEPKYKVGDEAWLNDNDSPGCIFISDITFKNHYYEYNGLYYEDRLYPTKAALIEAQIEYWCSLIEKAPSEMLHDHHLPQEEECDHEKLTVGCSVCDTYKTNPNDPAYFKEECRHEPEMDISKDDRPRFMKGKYPTCKKCGEFYR